MTLGRGLDSLIPPQSNSDSQNQNPAPQSAPSSVPFVPPSVPFEPVPAPVVSEPVPALPVAPPESDANALVPKEVPVVSRPEPVPAPTPISPPAPQPTRPVQSTLPMIKAIAEPDVIRGDEAIFQIEVEKIKPNPHQPRRNFDEGALHDLASSIREFGVIQPLVVTKMQTETPMGTLVEYQLIAGERRLMASKMAGLPRVPVIIRNVPLEQEKLELAIIENLQREDLNPIENARAFSRLQDEFRLTQREIAVRLGKSRESIANTMRLLNLPTVVQDAIAKNQINESQGRLLLAVTDQGAQQKLFEDLLRESFSVRELKSRINKLNAGKDALQPRLNLVIDPELQFLKDKLELALGTPVLIQKSGSPLAGGGKIVIDFFSEEELRGIIEKIKPEEGSRSI